MEGNQTAKPIIMVVFPPLFLKKGQVNYFNSKGVKAANLGEGQLCKWQIYRNTCGLILCEVGVTS